MKPRLANKRIAALTRTEVLVVVVVLIVLAAVLLPALQRLRYRGCTVSCASLLKQVGISSRAWAMDHGGKFPMAVSITNGGTMELVERGNAYVHFRAMSNELSTPMILVCWEDSKALNESRKLMAAHALARGTNRGYSPPFFPKSFPVSYFVGVDADPAKPTTILAGDGNLEVFGAPRKYGLVEFWTNSSVVWNKPRHNGGGYIVFADSHVELVNSDNLRQALQATGVATNRLAIP